MKTVCKKDLKVGNTVFIKYETYDVIQKYSTIFIVNGVEFTKKVDYTKYLTDDKLKFDNKICDKSCNEEYFDNDELNYSDYYADYVIENVTNSVSYNNNGHDYIFDDFFFNQQEIRELKLKKLKNIDGI